MSDETVPDLYQLAFMPGCFRCPVCGFQLTRQAMCAQTGAIGTRAEDRQSEPCPNDGTMMVHVTYREQLDAYADRLKEELDRNDELCEELEAARAIVMQSRGCVFDNWEISGLADMITAYLARYPQPAESEGSKG